MRWKQSVIEICKAAQENCPTCNGRGFIEPRALSMEPCPMCDGTGRNKAGEARFQKALPGIIAELVTKYG